MYHVYDRRPDSLQRLRQPPGRLLVPRPEQHASPAATSRSAPGSSVGGCELGFAIPDPDDPRHRLVRLLRRHPRALRPSHRPRARRQRLADGGEGWARRRAASTASSGPSRSPSRRTTTRRSTSAASTCTAPTQRRPELAGHQPRPDHRRPELQQKYRRASPPTTSARPSRAVLFAIAESPLERGADLGRHQRRPGAA